MAEKDKKSSASFVPFRPLDSLFEPTVKDKPAPAVEGLTNLPVDDLYSFKDHPFRQYTEDKMAEMVESVQEHGVITPILVRPRKDGDGYEIISGHNRVEACRRAGIETIPATIRDLDDDTAIILMVDSNLKQREKLLPIEKAMALKMKLEAIKRQGARTDLTSAQVERKLSGKESRAIVAEDAGISHAQVTRFIRLTNLIPALQEAVNEGRLAFNPAVEVSYLAEQDQEIVQEICLQINKINLYTGQPFANVEFRLVDSNGQTVRTIPYSEVSSHTASSEQPGKEEADNPPIEEAEAPKRGHAAAEAPTEEAAEDLIATTVNFRVWAKDGEDTFFTDENGFVEFRYLPAGTYTLEEIYPTGYIGPEVVTFTLTDRDGISNPKIVTVENCPTGLKIIKVDAKSGNPLAGAGFCLKVKGESDFEILKLRKEADGSFFYGPNGSITDIITDGTGELVIYGLPLGEIWIEETVTPDGYFPISAQKVELTRENTNSEPLTFRIENHKFVKLGMDSDWWEFPALCSGVLLLLGGLVVAAIIVAKKRKRLREEA